MSRLCKCVMEFASEFEQDSYWSLMAGANNFFNGPLTCLDVEELKFPPYSRTLCAAAAHPKAEPKISVESNPAENPSEDGQQSQATLRATAALKHHRHRHRHRTLF